MQRISKTKLSGILSYVTIIINILFGLIFTPWLIGRLGTSQYAIYTLGMSVINYLAIDFGISAIITRFCVKYIIEKDNYSLNKLVGISTKVYLIIDAVMLCVTVTFYFFIGVFFKNLTPDEIGTFKVVYVICASMAVIIFPETPFDGLFIAYEKVYLDRLSALLYKIAYVIATVIVILTYNSVVSVILSYASLTVALKAWKYIYISRSGNIRPNLKLRDRAIAKNILTLSAWVMISVVANNFFFSIVPTLLGRYSNTKEITTFSIASAVEGYLYLFSTALSSIFLPRVTRLVTEKKDREVTDLMITVGRIQLAVISCIIIGIYGFGLDFISYWVGAEYSEAYYCLLIILTPCFIHMTESIALEVTYAKDRVKQRALCYGAGTLISIALTCVLSPKYGAMGAAIGIAVAEVIAYETALNIVYHRILGIDIWRFFKETHLRMLLPFILSFAVTLCVNHFIASSSFSVFAAKLGIWAAMHLVILWTLCLNRKEKAMICEMLPLVRRAA